MVVFEKGWGNFNHISTHRQVAGNMIFPTVFFLPQHTHIYNKPSQPPSPSGRRAKGRGPQSLEPFTAVNRTWESPMWSSPRNALLLTRVLTKTQTNLFAVKWQRAAARNLHTLPLPLLCMQARHTVLPRDGQLKLIEGACNSFSSVLFILYYIFHLAFNKCLNIQK